ncbi:Disrupted in renal carcinoma protein 2 [Nymphon striatum]|nr:Disrupted in renal carcinoma protein 2 [Nymphon striatum]
MLEKFARQHLKFFNMNDDCEYDDKSPLLRRVSKNDSLIPNVCVEQNGIESYTITNDSNSSIGDEISIEPVQQRKRQTPSLKVYKRRWILIGIFSLLCIMQNAVWNTWGPIAITAENYFGWKNSDIALLNNWGNVNVLLFILPAVWLLETKGVRVTVIVSTALLFLATLVRCITTKSPYAIWLMNTGQFLNGISIIITLIVPALLSSIWFPVQERITAITIISLACNLGTTLSFLIGLSITDVGFNNQTDPYPHHNDSHFMEKHEIDIKKRDGKDISMIMYSEFGICALLFITILIYFPNRPKLPPSFSASYSRTDFSSGMKNLFRNVNMWLLCLSTGITFGVNGNLITLLAIVLKNLHITQRQSQFMGLYSQLVGIFIPIFIGRFADKMSKIVKALLGFFWFLLVVTALLLLLTDLKYIPNSTVSVYILVVILNGCVAVSYPLMWELGCEIAYPASEGSTVGLMYFFQNIVGSSFLFFFKIPDIGTNWVLYYCAASAAFGFLLFLPIKVHYHRTHIDEFRFTQNQEDYESINT